MNAGVVRKATRREILVAGLAFASVSVVIGFDSASRARTVEARTRLPKVGALVLDERLGIVTSLIDFVHSRKPDLPLLAIRLDSFAAIELKPLFSSARVIAGISSGATLFCLERMGWDYGYRVTRRSEHVFDPAAGALGIDSTAIALADAIVSDKPEFFAAAAEPANRAYRPSMTDDTLHAWIMQTTVTSRKRAA